LSDFSLLKRSKGIFWAAVHRACGKNRGKLKGKNRVFNGACRELKGKGGGKFVIPIRKFLQAGKKPCGGLFSEADHGFSAKRLRKRVDAARKGRDAGTRRAHRQSAIAGTGKVKVAT